MMPEDYGVGIDDLKNIINDFSPPVGMAAEFERLGQTIGAAAYRTWFMGSQSWINQNGEIMIDCPTPLRARWIRENYAAKLSGITGRHVIVIGDDPMTVSSPTHQAWWQTHCVKTGAVVAKQRDPEEERVEIKRRLDAGESASSMMAPVAGIKVGVADAAQNASMRRSNGGYVREEAQDDKS